MYIYIFIYIRTHNASVFFAFRASHGGVRINAISTAARVCPSLGEANYISHMRCKVLKKPVITLDKSSLPEGRVSRGGATGNPSTSVREP